MALLAVAADTDGTAPITQREIAEITGYSTRAVAGAVARLRALGLLDVASSGNTYRFQAVTA